jgi:protein O-GlcNAc transferase
MNSFLAQAEKLLYGGKLSDAADLCRKSIRLRRNVAVARRLLAECLYRQSVLYASHPDLLADAEAALRTAIENDPNHADALNNLGSILLVTQHASESIQYFERAALLHPGNVAYLKNLAKAQEENDELEKASETLKRLAELDSANKAAYLLRDALLVSAITPSPDYASRARSLTLRKLAALKEHPGLSAIAPEKFPSTYFRFSYHGTCNIDINRSLAEIYLKSCPSLQWVAPHIASWQGPKGRIRLGIASRFLFIHSIGSTTRGLVDMIDREKFETFVIRLEPSPRDEVADAIDRASDSTIEVDPENLSAAREAIAKLELDILFFQDIGMEPLSYFLAFARLAPVQLTSFGHPDTTGIPTIDYFLSSENYEASGSQAHYSERLVMLPRAGTLSYYYKPTAPMRHLGREHFGFGPTDRIYCCPQMLFKVQPIMDRLFAAILEKDAHAVFVLIEPNQRQLRTALEQRIAQFSAKLISHVRFLPMLPHDEYLCLLHESAVVLDTVHFNGQNTSLEAFAMGIPVVTLPGEMQRERHTYGMYLQMEFMDLVAQSEAQYVDIAYRVANDKTYRDYCRQRIAVGGARLFENIEFVRSCESALIEMLEQSEIVPAPDLLPF